MSGDEGVVEAVVIEHRDAHAHRRHEAVDGREPVFALAEIGKHAEAAGTLAQADEQRALAVAFDEIEGAVPFRHVGAVGERLSAHVTRADGATCRPQEHIERLPGAAAVEHIAGPQRELVGKCRGQLFVDPLEDHAIDHAFFDVDVEHARRRFEHHLGVRERVAFLFVLALHRFGEVLGGVGERIADLHAERVDDDTWERVPARRRREPREPAPETAGPERQARPA